MAKVVKSFEHGAWVKVMRETHQDEIFRQPLIKTLEQHFQAKVVVFFTSFNREDGMIRDVDAEMLESILSAEPASGKILLIINSPGGLGLAAERIVNTCRAYSSNQFEVLVPHMAKSAATMICFGAMKIHMSKTAELGPVDPQVNFLGSENKEDKEDKEIWISAEEYIRSYDSLIKSASGGKTKRLEPFIQQLERFDARFVEHLRSLQMLSEDIAIRLLGSGMMKGKSAQKIRKAIDVFLSQARTRSHGRMINSTEAMSCGLNIQLLDLGSPVWHNVWELYMRGSWVVNQRCGKIIETSKTAVRT
jgi:ATP-dependent protease ClpP protease subunit